MVPHINFGVGRLVLNSLDMSSEGSSFFEFEELASSQATTIGQVPLLSIVSSQAWIIENDLNMAIGKVQIPTIA